MVPEPDDMILVRSLSKERVLASPPPGAACLPALHFWSESRSAVAVTTDFLLFDDCVIAEGSGGLELPDRAEESSPLSSSTMMASLSSLSSSPPERIEL